MSVIIDGSEFRRALQHLGSEIQVAARDAIVEALDAASRDAFATNEYRNHTWKLRTATRATLKDDGFGGSLTNPTQYASFVEFGTKPHVIKARRAKFLRFYWHRIGENVAFKQVNHPGTKPRPFMRHAGEVGGGVLLRHLESLVERATQRFSQAA